MIKLYKKLIVIAVLAAQLLVGVMPGTLFGRDLVGRSSNTSSSSSSMGSILGGFDVSQGSAFYWGALGASGLAAVVSCFSLGSRFIQGRTVSTECTEIEQKLKNFETGKLYNWRFEPVSDGLGHWDSAGSALEKRDQVIKALKNFRTNSEQRLVDEGTVVDPKSYQGIVRVCDKQIGELGGYITTLKKTATDFEGYEIREGASHQGKYKNFIEKAAGNRTGFNLDQRAWQAAQRALVDDAVKSLSEDSALWYGWCGRTIVPLSATAAGYYFGGKIGALIGLAYGAITGLSWGFAASYEVSNTAKAAKVCWECIKKRERLIYIRTVALELQTAEEHENAAGRGSLNSVSLNVGNSGTSNAYTNR